MDSIFIADPRRTAGGWGWTLAYGAALILLGAVAWSWPFASAVVIGFFLGWSLSIAGIFGILSGFHARHMRGHRLDAAVGVASLLLGLLILLSPLAGALTLLWTMSLWFAVSGVIEITTGLREKGERAMLLLLGAFDLLLSLVLLLALGDRDVGLVAVLAGLSFIASGVVTIAAALRLRRLARGE